MTLRRHISDLMETCDLIRTELWIVHRLPDTLHEVCKRFLLCRFICEPVDMNHWELYLGLTLSRALPPDLRICLVPRTNEAIEKLHCIYRQVHHAVMELQEVSWHFKLVSLIVVFIDKHTEVHPRIHIERYDSLTELVQLNVFVKVLDCNRVQVIGKHF